VSEIEKEEPTNELRALRRKINRGFLLGTDAQIFLQQKWKVTKGVAGKVEYSEEWRPLPLVDETRDE